MKIARKMKLLSHSILACLTIAHSASTLGINCRGSGLCDLATFEETGLSESIMQALRDAVYHPLLRTRPFTTTAIMSSASEPRYPYLYPSARGQSPLHSLKAVLGRAASACFRNLCSPLLRSVRSRRLWTPFYSTGARHVGACLSTTLTREVMTLAMAF